MRSKELYNPTFTEMYKLVGGNELDMSRREWEADYAGSKSKLTVKNYRVGKINRCCNR